MESLKLSFNAVMPIFILMLLGYLLKVIKPLQILAVAFFI